MSWKRLLVCILVISMIAIVSGCNYIGGILADDRGETVDDPGDNTIDNPGDTVSDPGDTGDDPSNTVDNPSDTVDDPGDAGDAPSDNSGDGLGNTPGTNLGPIPIGPGNVPIIPGKWALDDTNAAVTAVPSDAVSSIDQAVIRKGDLWLCATDGRRWRQTSTGGVTDILWAPDGQSLVFFQKPPSSAHSLYHLIPGQNPVKLDDNIIAFTAWSNEVGFVWSPDSTRVAYTVNNGETLRVKNVNGTPPGNLTLSGRLEHGPYWLANDVIAISSKDDNIPSVQVISTINGSIIHEFAEYTAPYPVFGNLVMAKCIIEHDENGNWPFMHGLSYANPQGTDIAEFYTEPVGQLAREPKLIYKPTDSRYFAGSDGETLFLLKYQGISLSGPFHPSSPRTNLITQDVFVTYSEFHYPFWFEWAPNASRLAALRFTFTQEGNAGEQEGFWDLLLVNRDGTEEKLVKEIYSVSGDEHPVPFHGRIPIRWSPAGDQVFYLVERGQDDYDLWSVQVSTKDAKLVMEHCSLPDFRP